VTTFGDELQKTLFLELTLIKSVLLWLIRNKKLPASRQLDLPLAKPQGSDVYSYKQAEVAAIISHCRTDPRLHWLGRVIVAIACTGLRISEVAALRWTDLDIDSRSILLTDERASGRRQKLGTMRMIKGRRDRSLPIHPDFYAVLVGMKRHPDGLIFHGPRGGRLKPDTMRTIFVDEVIAPLKQRFPTPAGEIGFEHGRIHSFRHFFCSQAFRGGAREADLRNWLGHRESKMVDHYRHLEDADSRMKMDRIDFLGLVDPPEASEG
jgi:integrase